MEVSPYPELSGDFPHSCKPRKCCGEPSFRGGPGRFFAPRSAATKGTRGRLRALGGTRVPASPEPTWGLHRNLGARARARASVAYGELFCNLPESEGKCLPCKDMPFRDHLKLSGQRADPSSLQELRLVLTAPNLTAEAANLAPAPSHHSHSSPPGLSRPGRLGLARHARLPRTPSAGPAGTAPDTQAGSAGTRRPPGAIFLESRRAPGCALLTCVFFIRKGSAVIQPRQRCGDSV